VKVRVPRRRLEAWLRALEAVEALAREARRALGRVSVLLHGSYARGDFNIWSDIDAIVVSEAFEGVRVLDRYDLISETPPGVELVPMTPGELRASIEKPAWRHALKRGVVIVVDDLNVERLLRSAGIEPITLEELRSRIKKLMGSTVEV